MEHSAKDCSTPKTRKRVKGYINPHHESIRQLLDEEQYTLSTFRINNGSDYLQRRYQSENAIYDYSAYGVEVQDLSTNVTEEYDSNLILEDECSQGDFQKIPNSQSPCQ